MASVEFEHVDKLFPGGARAVADLCLRIDDGELVALVGPSGCGKSTALRLVAGLEQPSAGRLRIGEQIVNQLGPQQRNVAMVFQDYALYPYLSARGNLEFPLKMRRVPRDARRRQVERIAGLLDIVPLLDRLPRQLSGGQRQRVAMGRALVREPAVFLLDEPLSNLDAKLRVQVRAEIKDLQRRSGTTMIYVTHDQVEAMTLGDRVALLDRGVLRQVGSPADLYDRPASVFVAGFVGSPPMNLFATTLGLDDRGRATIGVGANQVPISPAGLAEDRLRLHLGARLTAGVRPEALGLVAPGATAGLHGELVPTAVEHIEWLGHETLAHVRVEGGMRGGEAIRLVARVAGLAALARGEAVSLRIDPRRVHLFDEAGQALGRG